MPASVGMGVALLRHAVRFDTAATAASETTLELTTVPLDDQLV